LIQSSIPLDSIVADFIPQFLRGDFCSNIGTDLPIGSAQSRAAFGGEAVKNCSI
jgi:hypothetical protein